MVTERQAIVGGNEAWLSSAVALTTTQCTNLPAGNPAICSGLLISPTTVLTARHCVSFPSGTACPSGIDPTQPSTFRVAIGCHDIVNSCPSANWKPVAATSTGIVMHPTDDIAIVHLAEAVTVTPTRLASPARVAEVNVDDSVTLHGWGMTAETGVMSPVLRSLVRPVLSIPLNLPGFNDPGVIATSCQTNPYAGSQHGDSGGPVLVLRDGEWFSLGVIQSGAYGTQWTNSALVPHYFQWILDTSSDFAPQSWLPSAQIMTSTPLLG
jgi:secreted trypsin-like serine protease